MTDFFCRTKETGDIFHFKGSKDHELARNFVYVVTISSVLDVAKNTRMEALILLEK